MLSLLRRNRKANMSARDTDIIQRFAEGDESLRDEAIKAHRRNILTVGVRGNAHQRFMAEIDTPVPDLYLRDRYRKQLLA